MYGCLQQMSDVVRYNRTLVAGYIVIEDMDIDQMRQIGPSHLIGVRAERFLNILHLGPLEGPKGLQKSMPVRARGLLWAKKNNPCRNLELRGHHGIQERLAHRVMGWRSLSTIAGDPMP